MKKHFAIIAVAALLVAASVVGILLLVDSALDKEPVLAGASLPSNSVPELVIRGTSNNTAIVQSVAAAIAPWTIVCNPETGRYAFADWDGRISAVWSWHDRGTTERFRDHIRNKFPSRKAMLDSFERDNAEANKHYKDIENLNWKECE